MAARSGIEPSEETLQAWQDQLNDQEIRLVKWSVDGEKVVPAGAWPAVARSSPADDTADAFEADFGLFNQEGIAEDKTPAYFALRRVCPCTSSGPAGRGADDHDCRLSPPPSSTFAFIAYVPDHAPVRPKMLYASSTNTLVRALGDSRFPVRMSAAEKGDLTYKSYLSTVTHDSAAAPLTAREAEMAEIRAAEASTADDADSAQARAGRSIIFGHAEGEQGGEAGETSEITGALPWADEVKEKVRQLGTDAEIGSCAVLASLLRLIARLSHADSMDWLSVQEIDIAKETIVLAADQPSSLAAPTSSPCYLLYRHAAGLVLIYSCPASSPIKSRLVYSSALLVFYKRALPQWTGQTVIKKLETSDPSEITPDWIDTELGPLAATASTDATVAGGADESSTPASGSASGTSTPKPESEVKFARPARPGRRR
ncbi:hypothetical protein BMF94_7089 [Rhodotorula taiwanensis]|uniref:ADF-H domain-containing protein n=1 Tax=Rhodotorula taiwanensis TaxID=741276 RepID=A0A2S5AZE0_9BASI|nr:hypothetical protein BMF94_7089 [Rhodotorula taiwanensis]